MKIDNFETLTPESTRTNTDVPGIDPQTIPGLIEMALYLMKCGTFENVSRGGFQLADKYLDELQRMAGNHKGFAESRILWIKQALHNFEQCVVITAERGAWPFASNDLAEVSDQDAKDLLIGTKRIRECLCGYYTQAHKAELEKRYAQMCRRIATSPVPEQVSNAFAKEAWYQVEGKVLRRCGHN